MPVSLHSSEDLKTPPKHLLAIDPGKANGWAKFTDGELAKFGIVRGLDKFDEFLQNYIQIHGMPDVVVYETFVVFRHKAQQQAGSKMEASQAIGKINFWCSMLKIPVVKQPSSILPTAILWSKMPMPKNHDVSHDVAAANHGVYYLVKNGMKLPTGI